jgi:YVTN family beta-propeller protein
MHSFPFASSVRPRALMLATFALGAVLVAATPAAVGAQSTSAPAPKAYIGLFKDNAVAVLDTSTNTVTRTIPIAAGPHGLVVTPDGRWVYASSDGASTVSVIDTRTDQVSTTIDVGQTPHGLAITPDGSRVLVAGFGTDQVEAIDTATNQVVWQASAQHRHYAGWRNSVRGQPIERLRGAGSPRPGHWCADRQYAARPHTAGTEHQPGRR